MKIKWKFHKAVVLFNYAKAISNYAFCFTTKQIAAYKKNLERKISSKSVSKKNIFRNNWEVLSSILEIHNKT
jgi:hypothetical protein